MGEHTINGSPVSFDSRLRPASHGTKITNDANSPACRELDEAFGVPENASAALSDPHHGENT